MFNKFCVISIFIFITLSSINCQKHAEKPCKLHEDDSKISDFLLYYLDTSIRVKLLWQLIYSIIGSTLVGLSGILPLLLISSETGIYLRSKSGITTLNRWLSFAFGSIIGDVFLHLLPEAWENMKDTSDSADSHIFLGSWVIIGFCLFFIIEKVFIENNIGELEHESEKEIQTNKEQKGLVVHSKENRGDKMEDFIHKSEIQAEGYLNLIANFTDNFTHGLAIGGSFLISFKVGVLTTTCILIHEVPHEVSDFVILLRAGFNRWKAAKLQLLTAGGSFLGAVFALFADSAITGWSKNFVLPFTSGAFIYIAMVSLLPPILMENSFRESVIQLSLIGTGFFIMITMSQFCG